MQKRLKEIVIYILENGKGLEPGQRAKLEEVREQLGLDGLDLDEIEAAIQSVLNLEGDDLALADSPIAVEQAVLDFDAADYLQRLSSLGLIDEEQEEEILLRVHRLHAEGAGLAEVQFLAAAVIFDETLAESGWMTSPEGPGPSKH